jgi:hypothetical protein
MCVNQREREREREKEQYVANHRKQVHKNSKKMSTERSSVDSLKDRAEGGQHRWLRLLVLVEWLKVTAILQTNLLTKEIVTMNSSLLSTSVLPLKMR